MGRAMIIIVSGLLISVGITQSSQRSTLMEMTRHGVNYAERTQAYNMTHSALELSIESFMEDLDNCIQGSLQEWEFETGVTEVEHIYCADPDDEEDITYRLRATSQVWNTEHRASVTYTKQRLHFVPDFEGAIGIYLDEEEFSFTIEGAAADIDGTEASGTCDDGTGVVVKDPDGVDKVNDYDSQIDGDPPVSSDPDMEFDEVSELISRLENQPGTVFLSGNVNSNLGSPTNPGVFFVTTQTELKGGASEGWGILVIRTNGELEMEGDLDLGGNFTFNGLVIFENAFSLSAKGTPSINGSMLIGKTDSYEGMIDVDIRGNVNIQYDCSAHEFARTAAENVINAGPKFTARNVFE